MSTSFQWTLADYHRMIQAGLFDGPGRKRVEFIRGEVREMTPIGPRHVDVVMRLTRWSFSTLPEGTVSVSVQSPLRLAGSVSEPEPDLVWLEPRDYSKALPTAENTLLLIEVADTSLDYDRGEKCDLYAQAEIPEYWLVDLLAQVVEVRRDPLGGHYRSLQSFSAEQEVRPLRFHDAVLRPAMLF